MQQCSQCQRFLSDEVTACRYCGSPDIGTRPIPVEQDEELINYKIFADSIFIDTEKYRIIDAVGQGAHGVVLRVKKETAGGKYFALKVPLEFNELFTNSQGNKKSLLDLSNRYITHEIGMLNRITSEALLEIVYAGPVTVKGRDVESELPAILMELAWGTLKRVMDNEMAGLLAVPYDEKVNMIKQLTASLELLHEKIVVHRDISPHNVFIVDRGKEIRYVPGDFGTSKPANLYDVDNSTTRMAFHDRYLDPALFRYEKYRYDCRIDIYQLGVMITEILLGEYWMKEDEETGAAGLQGLNFERDFLMKVASHKIHPILVEKIRKATTLKINRRYRSAGEFKKEIHDALERVQLQPVHKKNSLLEPGKPVKKIYILLIGIIFLLVVGIAVYNQLINNEIKDVSAGALNRQDRYGMTLLHHAVIRSDTAAVRTLIEKGADLNTRDHYGWTPLHWAVFKRDQVVYRFLVQKGASITIKTTRKWFRYPAGITAEEIGKIK
jgi:serine/threonine protein kinase